MNEYLPSFMRSNETLWGLFLRGFKNVRAPKDLKNLDDLNPAIRWSLQHPYIIQGAFVCCLLFLLAMALLFYYHGFFMTPKVQLKDTQQFYPLVAVAHFGPLDELEVPVDIQKRCLDKRPTIKATKWFGLCLDNPSPVPQSRWKSLVGYILDEYTKEDLEFLEQTGYKIVKIPQFKRAIYTEFPYVSLISPFIASNNCYYAMKNFFQQEKIPKRPTFTLEIFDPEGKKITYIRPLDEDKSAFEKIYYQSKDQLQKDHEERQKKLMEELQEKKKAQQAQEEQQKKTVGQENKKKND